MTDAEIAASIQRLGLEVEYLKELAASLGFSPDEGWTEAVFEAMDHASPEQRRRAALRTLSMDQSDPSR